MAARILGCRTTCYDFSALQHSKTRKTTISSRLSSISINLMKISTFKLQDSLKICRYIDLPKLFELILHERLFFPTLQTLAETDPFECGLLINKRYKTASRADLEATALSLTNHIPASLKHHDAAKLFEEHKTRIVQAKGEDLKRHVLQLEALKWKTRIVCTCWHAGDESESMWKLYAGQLGVMLLSTVGDLKNSLKGRYTAWAVSPDPQKYTVAPVKYINSRKKILEDFYTEKPWFLKRSSFSHEKEIRLAHELSPLVPSGIGAYIEVSAVKLLKGIVLSPLVPGWAADSLKNALEVILAARKLSIPLTASQHLNYSVEPSTILSSLKMERLIESIKGRSLKSTGN